MPQRSIVARRMSVRRSAAGDGAIPLASSRARMKASTGEAIHERSLTGGGGVGRIGRKAQCSAAGSVPDDATLALPTPVGHGAPIATHCVSSATSASGSFPLGGIFRSSWRCATAWIIRLSSGRDGTAAGPESPPFRMASRLSSRRLEDCFFGPWQFRHFSTRIGRIRASKNSAASGARPLAGVPGPSARASSHPPIPISTATAANTQAIALAGLRDERTPFLGPSLGRACAMARRGPGSGESGLQAGGSASGGGLAGRVGALPVCEDRHPRTIDRPERDQSSSIIPRTSPPGNPLPVLELHNSTHSLTHGTSRGPISRNSDRRVVDEGIPPGRMGAWETLGGYAAFPVGGNPLISSIARAGGPPHTRSLSATERPDRRLGSFRRFGSGDPPITERPDRRLGSFRQSGPSVSRQSLNVRTGDWVRFVISQGPP